MLQNRKEVFNKTMMDRYERAKKLQHSVVIVTQEEAEAASKVCHDQKTWKFHADMVRDFGFATSRRFIWDMMAVKLATAISWRFPFTLRGNPLLGWMVYESGSKYAEVPIPEWLFDYPYHKAISVHAKIKEWNTPWFAGTMVVR